MDEALVALGDEVGEAGRRARVAYIERHGAPPNDEGRPDSWWKPLAFRREHGIDEAVKRVGLVWWTLNKRDLIQLEDIWASKFFARDESHTMAPMPRLDPAEALEMAQDASAALASEAESVLDQLDGLASVWGDEGVFRTCRDRLRKALGEFKAAGTEGGGA